MTLRAITMIFAAVLGAVLLLSALPLGYRIERGTGELAAFLAPFGAAILFGQTIGRIAPLSRAVGIASLASIGFLITNNWTLDWIEQSAWADTDSSSMNHLFPPLLWLSWTPSVVLSGAIAARVSRSQLNRAN